MIAVIGGGPAGLFAARLIKLNQPSTDVVVYERNGSDVATFGFGVGLTEATMSNIAAADPHASELVRQASHAGHDLQLRTGTASVPLHGARNLAIGRAELLAVLTKLALEAGVTIRDGQRVLVDDITADVIVAADGVRSATRAKYAEQLGVHESIGRGLYMWCGTDFAVDSAFFSSRTLGDGLYVAHAYPYTSERSTFLLETDDETWDAVGLGEFDAATAPGESDERSLAILTEAFADELAGHRLLANRSRWARFSTIGLDRWWADNVVFLGDAAHTAHYTLGSGTKLAMEDAIALSQALAGTSDIAAAFAEYETRRRPPVDRFKLLAARSQRWWESYRLRYQAPAEQIALSFMTRAGNLSVADFARNEPETAAAALASLGGGRPSDPSELDDWIMTRMTPATDAPVADVHWREPDVWGREADTVVTSLASARAVRLDGPDDDSAVGARIDLAERIRLTSNAMTIVALPDKDRTQGTSAVAARRCDRIELRD
ncbi:FAD-dependent monooxygenase [Jongsikchunia kroppenstedtii]|uniref:FAD-dependent monooxygenase n=1 Tax=Jongsikchunia kroppenstedtii TaxID=1121721 RepID=UPI00138AE524|nr:FAD-dependent monooxygenase [Jongsikchunia kroppenstedtii]